MVSWCSPTWWRAIQKTGEVVRGLTQSDFTILESGKAQHIETFDFESVDRGERP